MAVLGAYEEDGMVVIEFSDHPPTKLSWREAMKRCRAVQESEAQVSAGRREPGIQKAIEQIIGASREARKKDPAQANWTPPASLSMYRPGTREELESRKRANKVGLILPP